MSIAQTKAARRKNKLRYRKPRGRTISESIQRERDKAARLAKIGR